MALKRQPSVVHRCQLDLDQWQNDRDHRLLAKAIADRKLLLGVEGEGIVEVAQIPFRQPAPPSFPLMVYLLHPLQEVIEISIRFRHTVSGSRMSCLQVIFAVAFNYKLQTIKYQNYDLNSVVLTL